MMSDATTGLAVLWYPWRATVHPSLLNALLNPGSPFFPATAHHLQDALTILANTDPLTLVAALGVLGVQVIRVQRDVP